jgi:hypothetical protein
MNQTVSKVKDYDFLKPNQTVGWEALPGSQTLFLESDFVFELLYHGTRGPGKSASLLVSYFNHVGRGLGSDWKGIIFRQTYKQLKDLYEKSREIFDVVCPEAKFNQAKYEWTFPDGEILLFRQFQREEDYYNYHGHEYPFIGWDELTNWKTSVGYKRMMSCCRTTNPDVPKMIRSTTNPYGPGHNWVKSHFMLPEKDGVILRKKYRIENPITKKVTEEYLTKCSIKGTLWENTILLESDPTYVIQLKQTAKNPEELKAWTEGDWNIVAGGMFDDVWSEKYNVVKPFEIPAGWKLDRSYDWGSSSPFSVGWWAESDGSDYVDGNGKVRSSVKGDLYRVGEWYGWTGQENTGLKMLDADIAKGIKDRERSMFGNRVVQPGPADTQIYNVENGRSIASEMSTYGVSWTRADKSSRVNGWANMRSYIKQAHPNEPIDGVSQPREKPGLFVFETCSQFRRTVPVLTRSDKNLDDVDDKETEDHIADETRYRIRACGKRVRSGRHKGMV